MNHFAKDNKENKEEGKQTLFNLLFRMDRAKQGNLTLYYFKSDMTYA